MNKSATEGFVGCQLLYSVGEHLGNSQFYLLFETLQAVGLEDPHTGCAAHRWFDCLRPRSLTPETSNDGSHPSSVHQI